MTQHHVYSQNRILSLVYVDLWSKVYLNLEYLPWKRENPYWYSVYEFALCVLKVIRSAKLYPNKIFFPQYSNGPKIRLWYIDPDNNKKMSTSLDKQQIFGELTYVLQPLIHLSSLGIFGIKSWTPWLLSVICDILRWIFYKKWRPLISREKFQHLYKHGCGVFSYFHNSKKLLIFF